MNDCIRRLAVFFSFAALMLVGIAPEAAAQVSLTTFGVPYTQDFNTLPASGSATWTNNSTIPGWFHARTGTGTTIVANNGSSNAGNLYSYGTGTSSERALGSVGSGNAAVGSLFWGVRLQNNTGSTITQLDVAYTGEQWRNSAAATQTVLFSYIAGSPTVTGSLAEFQSAGVAVAALNFASPVTGGAAGALDGNLAANRTAISFSITGLSIPNGTEIMLRWADSDHVGADHGLSIDDFSVTPQGAPPSIVNIGDASLTEGDSGTSAMTFTVTLSDPQASTVTVEYDTSDNGSAAAGSDYAAESGVVTFNPGDQSEDITIDINGDTDFEADETFLVTLTDPSSNAVIGDGEATGTILNDDPEVADLDLTMAVSPAMIGKGDNATFTLVVTNNGPQTATNVVVNDDLPNEVTLVSVSTTQGSCTTADPVVCSIGTLTSGSSATITIDVTMPKKFDEVTNTATATANEVDPTPASASATVDCTKKPKDPKPCRQVGLQ